MRELYLLGGVLVVVLSYHPVRVLWRRRRRMMTGRDFLEMIIKRAHPYGHWIRALESRFDPMDWKRMTTSVLDPYTVQALADEALFLMQESVSGKDWFRAGECELMPTAEGRLLEILCACTEELGLSVPEVLIADRETFPPLVLAG